MKNNDFIHILTEKRLIPVVSLQDENDTKALVRALLDADLCCMEITYRTDAAAKAISIVRDQFPEIVVGAGTIITVEQAENAVNAGSQYIVSPGFNTELIHWCQLQKIPVIPGVATPTEIMKAMDLGLTTLKFFPAEALGGIRFLSGMSGPFPNIKFIPSGGINEKNLDAYIKQKNVIAVGGSWFVKNALISSNQYQEITRLTKKALDIIDQALM